MNNVKLVVPLLTFAEVANRQSFTLAAQHLGLSKSAVSQQIARLEEASGQQLLSRHTRGMSLTAAGKRLLARCELLREHIDLAFEELGSHRDMPTGTFSITLPHSMEKAIVIPALRQLCIEYPGLEPRMVVTDEPLDLIRDKLDVAIYAGELKDSSYRALPIGVSDEVLCASPVYLNRQGPLNQPDDLVKHRWISAPWQHNPVLLNRDDTATSVKLNRFLQTNTLTSTLDLVLNEMGFALIPEYVLHDAFREGRLVRMLPEYRGRRWAFHMVHRFHGEKPVHVTRFHKLVKHFFDRVSV